MPLVNTTQTVRAASWAPRWRADSWANLSTGIGTPADKRTGGYLVLDVVTDIEARQLWRGNDLAKRIIETQPKDEIRRGFDLKMGDKERAEKILSALEEIPGPSFVGKGMKASFIRARMFERAYGGSAIFPVINDSEGSLATPLNEKAITKIERLRVFEPRELRPFRRYPADSPKSGEIETYQVMPINGSTNGHTAVVEIHETRLIIFPGVRVSAEDLVGTCYGWGDGCLTPVRGVLNDFELTFGSAANLMQDFAQAVLKLDGLAEVLGVDGQNEATSRLSEMNRWRSALRALVLDSKDTFERVTTPLTGMAEMLDRFMFRMAAAAEMPVSKLMGMAPAGLNATGESDISNWDDVVASGQLHITPMLERLIQLFLLSEEGGRNEPDVWSVEFFPLRQPNMTETAQARATQSQTDKNYIDAGVLSPEEVAFARFGGDTYSFETIIDFEERDAMVIAANADPTNVTEVANVDPANASLR